MTPRFVFGHQQHPWPGYFTNHGPSKMWQNIVDLHDAPCMERSTSHADRAEMRAALIGRQVGRYTIVSTSRPAAWPSFTRAPVAPSAASRSSWSLKLLQAAVRGEPARRGDVPRRGAPRREAQPPEHRPRLRRRRGRRHEVHRHGVHPRRDADRHRPAAASPCGSTCRSSTPLHIVQPGGGRASPTHTPGASTPTAACCASSTATSRPRTSSSPTKGQTEDCRLRHRARRRTSFARSGDASPGKASYMSPEQVTGEGVERRVRTSSRSASSSTSSRWAAPVARARRGGHAAHRRGHDRAARRRSAATSRRRSS